MASTEFQLQCQLNRTRRFALGLLLAMATLMLSSRTMQTLSGPGPAYELWGYVSAFSKAALIGGLADWFAVTALFRHPLGLKIPHTAILPSNKERIGESIGNFLQYNFLTREVFCCELSRLDFVDAAAAWLADKDNSDALADQLTGAAPFLLRQLGDETARDFFRNTLAGLLNSVRLAPALARVLELLVAGRQHHLLFERLLGIVARALEQNRPYLRQKVHEHSPGWLPKSFDEQLFERILDSVQIILIDIQSPDSQWRMRFDRATQDMIDKLATSPDYEAKLRAMLANVLNSEAFTACTDVVWNTVRQRLTTDGRGTDPMLAHRAGLALHAMARGLQVSPVLRERINGWLRRVAADTLIERRDVVGALVSRVVRSWDADTVSRKFELQVGKDLQYIRFNGTVVGGAIGVLLHALSRALGG